ncbi:MAG: VOC family protein [Candidatus Eremiobacteraeota bacterium]|nr:VOC family protein [Candidatus Eremiobacteraeota bacterium]
MELKPYVFFYGRCEEALNFYKNALGGDYEVMRIKDSPMANQWPDKGNSVMHASFNAPGVSFFASDGQDAKSINADEGNISLALATKENEGERVFNALADGGKVTMPIEDAFWGGKFGIVQDRFGVEWMMTIGGPF